MTVRKIYELLSEQFGAEGLWWIILGIIAVVLVIAVAVSLFRLHREIEYRDHFYVNEFDCQYLPRRR